MEKDPLFKRGTRACILVQLENAALLLTLGGTPATRYQRHGQAQDCALVVDPVLHGANGSAIRLPRIRGSHVVEITAFPRLMNMSSTGKYEQILQRLEAHLGKAFEGYTIRRESVSHQAAARFVLRRGDAELLLDVGRDFLEAQEGGGMLPAPGSLRSDLERAEGMPMILTAEGLRLASSN